MSAPKVEPPIYVWAALGRPDEVPDRVQVESCTECGGLVRTDRFDQHGLWHAQLNRELGLAE